MINTQPVVIDVTTETLKLRMSLVSLSISWSPKNSIYSFVGDWIAMCASDDEWLSNGTFSFELEVNGKKPRNLKLEGLANVKLTPEERTRVAIEIKRHLRSHARTAIDQAWRQMQTQLQMVW